MSILYSAFFCYFDLFLLFPFFIPPKCDLNITRSFFASVVFISPFCIISIRSEALLYLPNFSSGLLPLYLYTKSLRLTFLSNSVISLSLLSFSLLNLSFFFEINGLFSSS